MSKTALLIGATSSLAQPLARQLAQKGWQLVLLGRDEEAMQAMAADLGIRYNSNVTCLHGDMANPAFDAANIMDACPQADAAFMLAGTINEADITGTMQVNLTAPALLLQAIADDMQARKRGQMVIVSSVAGDRGRQSNYVYGAAKAGLTAFASGLRNRLTPHGVQVMTVRPGFVDTPMTWGMTSPLIADRERVASAILKAMKQGKDTIYAPFFWRYIMLIIRLIPEAIFKKLRL